MFGWITYSSCYNVNADSGVWVENEMLLFCRLPGFSDAAGPGSTLGLTKHEHLEQWLQGTWRQSRVHRPLLHTHICTSQVATFFWITWPSARYPSAPLLSPGVSWGWGSLEITTWFQWGTTHYAGAKNALSLVPRLFPVWLCHSVLHFGKAPGSMWWWLAASITVGN